MKTAVIFGAGRVGRGFLAEVFQQSGYSILLADMNINLVDQINRQKHYTINKAHGALMGTTVIDNVRAFHYSEEGSIVDALCEEDAIAAVAVSPYDLNKTAATLAVAIARRALESPEVPLDIYLCENNADPAARTLSLLEGMLGGAALNYLHERVGLVRTIVMRLFADSSQDGEDDPLSLLNNGYPDLIVEASAFRGERPDSAMISLCENYIAESTRKSYTLNMAQAAMAYIGQSYGIKEVSQALNHPRVRPYIQEALAEAAHGLCGEFGFARRQMDEWNSSILSMLENPALKDSLMRYGIDTGRKVGPNERLVGAATLCQKYGRTPHSLARIIAHAYLFKSDDPGTRRVLGSIHEDGIELALERFSRIDYKSPLLAPILEEYQRASGLLNGE